MAKDKNKSGTDQSRRGTGQGGGTKKGSRDKIILPGNNVQGNTQTTTSTGPRAPRSQKKES